MMRKSQAQSILEYVIVLSAIVAAVIAMAKGPVTTAVNKMFKDSAGVISDTSESFYQHAASSGSRDSAVGGE